MQPATSSSVVSRLGGLRSRAYLMRSSCPGICRSPPLRFNSLYPHIVRDRSIVQLCRRTISLIQIGANGEVQPLETG
jgi:hypothetical protein